jgi:hypothetical protein
MPPTWSARDLSPLVVSAKAEALIHRASFIERHPRPRPDFRERAATAPTFLAHVE